MSQRNYQVGDCAYLAAAILEIDPYNFQVAIFDGAGAHVAAIHNGAVIDVDGSHTPDQVAAQWESDGPTLYDTWDEVHAEGWDVYLERHDLEAARDTLARVGLLTPARAEAVADLIDRRY